MQLIGSCSDMVRAGVLVLRPLERDSSADQFQTLPVTGPGVSAWIYKATHSLCLPLLGLDVQGEACKRKMARGLELHNLVSPLL